MQFNCFKWFLVSIIHFIYFLFIHSIFFNFRFNFCFIFKIFSNPSSIFWFIRYYFSNDIFCPLNCLINIFNNCAFFFHCFYFFVSLSFQRCNILTRNLFNVTI